MRLLHVPGNHAPEALQSVFLDRHPDLECTELAGQLQSEVAGPVIAGSHAAAIVFALQVFRNQGKRVTVGGRIADDHATGFKRDVHPLVQIKCDRVGTFDSGKLIAHIVRQHGHRADGAVDMKPQAFLRAKIGDGIHVVDGASINCPGGSNDAEGNHASLTVLRNLVFQRVQIDGVVVLDGNFAQPVGTQPQGFDRFLVAAVNFCRGINGEWAGRCEHTLTPDVVTAIGIPGNSKRGEICHRSAAGQDSAGALRKPHHIVDPADHLLFNPGCNVIDSPDVGIQHGCQKISHRPHHCAAAHVPGPETRMVGM